MRENGCSSSRSESQSIPGGVTTEPHARASAHRGSAAAATGRRRWRSLPPARLVLLAMGCALAAGAGRHAHAFSSPPESAIRRHSRPGGRPRSVEHDVFRGLSAVAEPPSRSPSSGDFQRRMRERVLRRGGRRRVSDRRPENLRTAHTLAEYKAVLDEERDKIVVVRFFATWCKACQAMQPAYYRLAALHPRLIFLDVPVTNHNANLHQGLAVPSLPYGHVYYPGAGLVEELKISRRYFPDLVNKVRWYAAGECPVDEGVETSEEPSAT